MFVTLAIVRISSKMATLLAAVNSYSAKIATSLVLNVSLASAATVLPQRKMEKWHPCYSSQKEPKP
jgi:hypothetical protein